MPVLKPRNRVVVFRLTQDEYQDLKTVSSVRGARNISDFARSELLNSIGHGRLSEVDQRLLNLESAVQRVAQLLEGIAAK
jgi:hypothetical protein